MKFFSHTCCVSNNRPLGAQVSVCRQPRSIPERVRAMNLLLEKHNYQEDKLLDRFAFAVDVMEDAFLEAFAAWFVSSHLAVVC